VSTDAGVVIDVWSDRYMLMPEALTNDDKDDGDDDKGMDVEGAVKDKKTLATLADLGVESGGTVYAHFRGVVSRAAAANRGYDTVGLKTLFYDHTSWRPLPALPDAPVAMPASPSAVELASLDKSMVGSTTALVMFLFLSCSIVVRVLL
jgi:hypothetical protein